MELKQAVSIKDFGKSILFYPYLVELKQADAVHPRLREFWVLSLLSGIETIVVVRYFVRIALFYPYLVELKPTHQNPDSLGGISFILT